ncbi:tetratricopeptide repeat protein [Wenyingzhuangia sp. IMCC45533]
MKNLITGFLLMFVSFVSAQNLQNTFKEANNHYQKEDYDKAIDLYNRILKDSLESSEIYYNLGNAYYKTNQMAEAIYHYEKALILNPSNQDAQVNLAFANRSIIDTIKVVPKSTLEKLNGSVLSVLSYNGWAKIAVALSILGAVLWMLFFFSIQPSVKKLYFTLAVLISIGLLTTLFITVQQYSYTQNTTYAVIFVDKVEVKNAPRKSAVDTFTLHEGTKVKVLDKVGDWHKIKIADGQIGWMPATALKLL